MGGDNATVAVEFQRPGGAAPFALPRVVEPAYGFPAQLQPQADGVPGFRFGIEVIGTDADRELHRLALVLDHLLAQHAAQQQPSSRTAQGCGSASRRVAQLMPAPSMLPPSQGDS